ncbi:MAG: GlsB/YeaQ/YmgE family stress response membrane protein [Actinomycetota bacterium]|nr:GlsB/YeaQ/YmgE family stress response membrane protein [Actinomycetota bacterium]
MNILAWLVIGLVAGALARLLVPGRDPMGLFATVVLGLVGAFVGGFLAQALFDDSDGVGLFGSTAGAVVVLLLWNALVARNRRGVRGVGRRLVS